MDANIVKRFIEHYGNIDRSYGKSPLYRFNDTLIAVGDECRILKERFKEWCGYSYAKPEWYFHQTEDGTEYMSCHIDYYFDDNGIKKCLDVAWLIDNEEVFYNMYQK